MKKAGLTIPTTMYDGTEQRNLEAVMMLMSKGQLDVKSLTTHTFAFDEAMEAYSLIKEAKTPYVGIVLSYDLERPQGPVVHLKPQNEHVTRSTLGVGFVGAGNYAALHLLPHLAKDRRVQLQGLVTATGLNAQQKADRFGFRYCATDIEPLLEDDGIDTIFIATRHSTHASYTVKALNAGKHVFVEKPMVVSPEQLETVQTAYDQANLARPVGLMVGLNRRFSPMVEQLQAALPAQHPRHMIYRVNSGHIPTSSWLHEPAEGGGMLVGEMCHFIDIMHLLSGERPVRVFAQALTLGRSDMADHDNVSIVVNFNDGSVGNG